MSIDSVSVVRRYCVALGNLDTVAMLAEVDDGVALLMPVAPAGMPRRIDGRAALEQMLAPLAAGLWKEVDFPNLSVRAEADPQRVVAEFEGHGIFANGAVYDNTYVSLFVVRDGRIVEIKEFFDPNALAAGLS